MSSLLFSFLVEKTISMNDQYTGKILCVIKSISRNGTFSYKLTTWVGMDVYIIVLHFRCIIVTNPILEY